MKFHHDTLNGKRTRGQKPFFLYTDKCHNSVMNSGNLPINNPKQDIVGTNAYAKFELNPFINTGKPTYVVTSVKGSSVLSSHLFWVP